MHFVFLYRSQDPWQEDLWSPMAACDFADSFGAITVMPQGWSIGDPIGWSPTRLEKAWPWPVAT